MLGGRHCECLPKGRINGHFSGEWGVAQLYPGTPSTGFAVLALISKQPVETGLRQHREAKMYLICESQRTCRRLPKLQSTWIKLVETTATMGHISWDSWKSHRLTLDHFFKSGYFLLNSKIYLKFPAKGGWVGSANSQEGSPCVFYKALFSFPLKRNSLGQMVSCGILDSECWLPPYPDEGSLSAHSVSPLILA
jgi:hypothetical protein